MIDLGTLNNILNGWCSILTSKEATAEEKENALAKAKEVKDKAENEYRNQLDTNGDKLLTEEEYKSSAEYLQYLNLTTTLSQYESSMTNNTARETATETTTEGAITEKTNNNSVDVNNDGNITNLEYFGRDDNNSNNTTNNNRLNSMINSISNIGNIKNTTYPEGIINQIEIKINNIKNELQNGNYTTEETEKALKEMIRNISFVRTKIYTQYLKQHNASRIENERNEYNERKERFTNGIDTIIYEYQSILAELESTSTENTQRNSRTIIENINNIYYQANNFNTDYCEGIMDFINYYISNIKEAEKKNAFAGTEEEDYMSQETANQIIMALNAVQDKLTEAINNTTDEETKKKLEAIKSELEEQIEYYKNLEVKDRDREFEVPQDIKNLCNDFENCTSTKEKTDKLSEISNKIDELIAKKMAEYLNCQGNNAKEQREKIRAELKNLNDLKELFTISSEISTETLESPISDEGNTTYIDALIFAYVNLSGSTSEGKSNANRIEIRNLFNNMNTEDSSQKEIRTIIERYTNTRSQDTRDTIYNNLTNKISNLPKITKIKLLKEAKAGLESLQTQISNELNNLNKDVIGESNFNEIKSICDSIISEISRNDITKLDGIIKELES